MIRSKHAIRWSDFKLMLVMGLVFAALAIGLWLLTGTVFYLYNFAIIGTAFMFGMGLWPLLAPPQQHWARRISQLLVGGYMFFGLGMGFVYLGFGVISPENMQIEGFWFWLFAGTWAASVLHYFIAKIVGPVLFNRGWCGWACWTAAVLDLLPWKKSPGRIAGHWGYLRYGHFLLVMVVIGILVQQCNYGLPDTRGIVTIREVKGIHLPVYGSIWPIPELRWFLAGNMGYFGSGILLACLMRDNRAFCKYLCPIVVFFKIGARFSLLKIGAQPQKCTDCKACEASCPMDIRLTEYIKSGQRITSSECILCKTCTSVCPNDVLNVTFGFDVSSHDHVRCK